MDERDSTDTTETVGSLSFSLPPITLPDITLPDWLALPTPVLPTPRSPTTIRPRTVVGLLLIVALTLWFMLG